MRYIYLLLCLSIIASCSHRTKERESSINVMTFNIRYDNPEDSLNNWKYRKDRVANAIKFYEADVIGMQEVLHNQLVDLKKRLTDFQVLGVGREDGKEKGEYSALWINTKKMKIIESGYFWLSEYPDKVGSKGWDAACERIATWAKVKDLNNGKNFFVLNTHLDHVGQVAIKNSVKLLMKETKEKSQGLPVILTGDFNAEPNSLAIKSVLSDTLNNLKNSKDISDIVYGPNWSFHDFGKIPYNERPLIDYIFVNDKFKITRYGVLAETENNSYLSDHAPVLITAKF